MKAIFGKGLPRAVGDVIPGLFNHSEAIQMRESILVENRNRVGLYCGGEGRIVQFWSKVRNERRPKIEG